MIKAIFYKEWIKTRWFFIISLLGMLGFTSYTLLQINRVLGLKGAAHIWEVIITRDAIFIDYLQYIPIIIGILMAVVQFAPEMHRKCLKLTLHLPYSGLKLTMTMLLVGLSLLLIIFGCSLLFIKGYLMMHFPIELQNHILFTSFPWFLAGLLAYNFCSLFCLEPTWKMRVLYLVIAFLTLRIFFLSDSAEAYNSFLPGLIIYVIATISLPWLSILRFKAGKQD